jgi:hypothetical protein
MWGIFHGPDIFSVIQIALVCIPCHTLARSLVGDFFRALQGKGTEHRIGGDSAYFAGNALGLLKCVVLGCFSYDWH